MKMNERLKRANEAIESAKHEISRIYPDDFGSSMLCLDPSSQEGTLAAHRLRSKFFRPNTKNDKRLEKEAFATWLENDHVLQDEDWINCDRSNLLYKARTWLRNNFCDVKVDFSKIEISPGETFVSAKGETSVYQKLSKRKYWTVTHDAAEDFIRLCYNNLWLKRCAKAHMRKRTKLELKKLYLYALVKKEKHIGYSVFRRLMFNDVLTIVNGSRASSVPKNNEARRFINVEALGNVILQRCVALALRSRLAQLGNDLEHGQSAHRTMIADADNATIDFSSASDSVVTSWVKWFFPPNIWKYLNRYRSFITYVGSVAHAPRKLSSMGNGFTFEVMTTMLLSIARILDQDSRVYGDDVVIHNLVARDFIETCNEINFKVNQKKTFVYSPFRESCGAFYHDSLGYLTTYEFHWCESMADFIVSANKAYLIAKDSSNPEIRRVFNNLYRALLALSPTSNIGPDHSALIKPCENPINWDSALHAMCMYDSKTFDCSTTFVVGLDSYIFCKKWRKYHENDTWTDLHTLLSDRWGLPRHHMAAISCWRFQNEQVTPSSSGEGMPPFTWPSDVHIELSFFTVNYCHFILLLLKLILRNCP